MTAMPPAWPRRATERLMRAADWLAVRRPPLFGLLLLWALLAVGLHGLTRLHLAPPAPSLERLTLLGWLLPDAVLRSRLLFDGLRVLFAVASLLWVARRLLPASAWVATLSFLGAVSMAIEASAYTEHQHHAVTVLLGVQAVWFTVERRAFQRTSRARLRELLRQPLEPDWVAFAGLYYLAVTHTLAGLCKLRHAGLGWANGVSLQLWIHDEPGPRGWLGGLLAGLLMSDRRLALALQAAALAIETLAVLACLGGRLRRAIGVALLGLHLGIELVFGFEFYGTLVAVLILMVVRPAK